MYLHCKSQWTHMWHLKWQFWEGKKKVDIYFWAKK